jgi:hypothetical protein
MEMLLHRGVSLSLNPTLSKLELLFVFHSTACGGRVFVDKPIVIDAPIHDDCIWEFQTKDDRILLFTLVDGNLKEAQEFFKVSDHK